MDELVKYYEKARLKTWHNIGKPSRVKKSITYKEITVAIGILVAMVIALTLWLRVPDNEVSGSASAPKVGLPAATQNLFKTTVKIFTAPHPLIHLILANQSRQSFNPLIPVQTINPLIRYNPG
ncbi:MAG: hypothetical protein WD824_14615 [Cyclobacteriaceae bacterium]